MTSYATLGPPIPDDLPDTVPLRITRIEELRDRNGLGEAIILIDAETRCSQHPIKLIIAASPHTGEITRAAQLLNPGAGFVATDLGLLPGNLHDIVRTILLDPREA